MKHRRRPTVWFSDMSKQKYSSFKLRSDWVGVFSSTLYTYTKQLRSAKSSMKSNSWLMSYVIDGLLGFILFKCSSYILHTPVRETTIAVCYNHKLTTWVCLCFYECTSPSAYPPYIRWLIHNPHMSFPLVSWWAAPAGWCETDKQTQILPFNILLKRASVLFICSSSD